MPGRGRRGSARKKEKVKKPKKRYQKPVTRHSRNEIEEDKKLYCICKTRWTGGCIMVQCDICHDWFHPKCVGLSTKAAKEDPFTCKPCLNKPVLKLSDYKMHSYSA